MANRDDLLRQAVEEKTVPVFMTSKSEIVEYYQDTYGRNWRVKYTDDVIALRGLPNDRKTRNTISRQVQGERAWKAPRTAAIRKQWEQLGRVLPPIGRKLEGESITIRVLGWQGNGRGGQRHRDISVTLTGNRAKQFVLNPTFYDLWDAYGVEPDSFEDGDYSVDVYAVG